MDVMNGTKISALLELSSFTFGVVKRFFGNLATRPLAAAVKFHVPLHLDKEWKSYDPPGICLEEKTKMVVSKLRQIWQWGVFLYLEAISTKQKVCKCYKRHFFDIFLIVDKYLKKKSSVFFVTMEKN